MKNYFSLMFIFIILMMNTVFSQNVAVNETGATGDDSAILDVNSDDKGILIPRVALVALNDNAPIGASITTSLLVYNTATAGSGTNAVRPGFYYWDSTEWKRLIDEEPDVHIGKFIITGTGTINITGVPFEPSSVKLTAYGNVSGSTGGYNVDSDNGTSNNNGGISNSFNYMTGYATNYGSIDQQVICGGAHGNSINDISRYASNTECIGIRYGNQNGNLLGYLRGELLSFQSDGFTIDITDFETETIVIFTAYK
jgi:hypothetical protein